ncbi:barstar family protein [Streptomyces sp. ATCC 21386]|uniref:barstar family protein n=1 Tax=Streptomyces sp. ATCC 21386 TaxID=2699428 RepID=UPI001BFF9259|nr:barstar family protein [Streptomyces sp. ATCC 21386]
MTTTYVLDGTRIRKLEDFWRVIGETINGPGGYFGSNLDAFADCLSGGFGTPDDDDYVVEWRDHQASREHLSYPETARQLEIRLSRCHPTNRPAVSAELAAAREERGPTVFDWLKEIFEDRAPGVLRLE